MNKFVRHGGEHRKQRDIAEIRSAISIKARCLRNTGANGQNLVSEEMRKLVGKLAKSTTDGRTAAAVLPIMPLTVRKSSLQEEVAAILEE